MMPIKPCTERAVRDASRRIPRCAPHREGRRFVSARRQRNTDGAASAIPKPRSFGTDCGRLTWVVVLGLKSDFSARHLQGAAQSRAPSPFGLESAEGSPLFHLQASLGVWARRCAIGPIPAAVAAAERARPAGYISLVTLLLV